MKCFKCGKGKMALQTADITGEIRGEHVSVRCECTMCSRCGFQVLSEEQSNQYTIASADAYRERHGLLTSRQLKDTRQRLGLSQREFAAYLKVGAASVKRWEAGLIQDEALDQLIRLRTDPDSARGNIRELVARLNVPSPEQPQAAEVTVDLIQPGASRWPWEHSSMAPEKTRVSNAVHFGYTA